MLDVPKLPEDLFLITSSLFFFPFFLSVSLTHPDTHKQNDNTGYCQVRNSSSIQHTVLSTTDKQEAVGMFVYSSVETEADVCCDYSDYMFNQLSVRTYQNKQQFAVVFNVVVLSISTQNKVYNSL